MPGRKYILKPLKTRTTALIVVQCLNVTSIFLFCLNLVKLLFHLNTQSKERKSTLYTSQSKKFYTGNKLNKVNNVRNK
jgi:hypothetical protein